MEPTFVGLHRFDRNLIKPSFSYLLNFVHIVPTRNRFQMIEMSARPGARASLEVNSIEANEGQLSQRDRALEKISKTT